MKVSDSNSVSKIDPLKELIQAMQDDALIHDRIINLLHMDSCQRRITLNKWLEHLLRQGKARQDLLCALACLLDDTMAGQLLALMNKHNKS